MTPSQRAAWTNIDNTAAHSQKLFTWSVNNFTSPTHYTTYSDPATIARTTITFVLLETRALDKQPAVVNMK